MVKARELDQEQIDAKSDYIGQSYFPKGDAMEIVSVERTQDQIVVKGHYQLVSADAAILTLQFGVKHPASPHVEAQQQMRISKGQGDFTLVHSEGLPGLPHVEMSSPQGQAFAELYFGTQAEALEEGKLRLALPQVESVLPAEARTNVAAESKRE